MNFKVLFGGGLAVSLNGLALSVLWGINPHPYFAAGCALVMMGWAALPQERK